MTPFGTCYFFLMVPNINDLAGQVRPRNRVKRNRLSRSDHLPGISIATGCLSTHLENSCWKLFCLDCLDFFPLYRTTGITPTLNRALLRKDVVKGFPCLMGLGLEQQGGVGGGVAWCLLTMSPLCLLCSQGHYFCVCPGLTSPGAAHSLAVVCPHLSRGLGALMFRLPGP